MRKITQQAVAAFNANQNFVSGNTVVIAGVALDTEMHLHGNCIARRIGGVGAVIQINNCGWLTNVTKERLNGLPGVSIYQAKGVWYLNGEEMPANRWITI